MRRLAHKLLGVAVVPALAAISGGCATTGDLEHLAARVAELERDRLMLRDKLGEDYSRLERLHAMITEAEGTLRKSGADLGNRMERLEQDFPKVRGITEAVEFRFNQVAKDLDLIKQELASRLGWTVVYLPNDLPKDKDGIWKAAEERGKADKLLEAKAIYELFEASFPDDPRAPQALVEIAKLYEKTGDLENAIKFYQAVYERHEKSALAAPSTFRIAELFVVRNNCDRAKAIFQFVEKQFKGTPEATQAKARVKTVANECKKP